MEIDCPQCRKTLVYSGERPSFCAYCGNPLRGSSAFRASVSEPTLEYQPEPDAETTMATAIRATVDTVPDVLGGYRLLRVLGSGGMGSVYEAEDCANGRRVAVKLLNNKHEAGTVSLDRFRQEGRLASLISHPRCVFVLSAEEEAGRPYIVMELMPGTTLRDLVEQSGPLAVDDAVAKILDVIDGLTEAHRHNILHRDVKPSNCFLMPDGRVKVGDFGLSKSLIADNNLTQSGAFLGTVLYASPEQLRGEPLDFGSDVYSVCATLYYLLTGRPPFAHDNPATVIARVIADPVTPIRELRPNVPAKLERIVLRGLDRDRSRRWQNLDELRAALDELRPKPLSPGGLGMRFAAYLIDHVVLMPLAFAGAVAFEFLELPPELPWVVLLIAYFLGLEGATGWSVGKFCLRFRVTRSHRGEPPSWARMAVRALVFLILTDLHSLVAIWDWSWGPADDVSLLVYGVVWLAGIGLLLIPMAFGKGYRGAHDRLSGTRVVQLPWPRPVIDLVPVGGKKCEPMPVDTLPERVGPYRPRAELPTPGPERALLAQDAALGREVLLLVGGTPTKSGHSTRPTRLRWLSRGTIGEQSWDAFLAPDGCRVADLVADGRGRSWAESRRVLEHLSEELAAAESDGSLPARLTLDQVWVRSDGSLQLLDVPLTADPGPDRSPVELLRRCAFALLEGEPSPKPELPPRVRAVVPGHAASLLDRLTDPRRPMSSAAEFRDALAATHDLPTQVTPQLRIGSLGLQLPLFAPVMAISLMLSGVFSAVILATVNPIVLAHREAVSRLECDPAFAASLGGMPCDRTVEQQIQYLRRIADNYDRLRAGRERTLNPAERLLVRGSDMATELDDEFVRRVARTEVSADPTDFQLFVPFAVVVTAWMGVALAGWVAWSFAFRGGWAFSMMGMKLVRSDGKPAARWQCALRTLAAWSPVMLLLAGCVWAKALEPRRVWLHNGLWWAAVALLVIYAVSALLRPRRGWHDRIAGTWLVPV